MYQQALEHQILNDSPPEDFVVAQAQQGDDAAFARLFDYFNGAICTYLARMVGNDELGRDLAQETFIKAWKSLPQMHGEHHFRAWLYRIATNVAISHQRRARLIRWLPWPRDDEGIHMAEQSVVGPEEWVGESELIQRVLAQLTPQYKACLLLRTVAGFSQREVAQMLNISEKSVSSNVYRGREQFRKLYVRLKGE